MTWSVPMTAIAGSVFTAAQFNLFVRDNFLETAPAKAQQPGQWIVTDDVNSVVARTITHGVSDGAFTTTSVFYDFPTDGAGPNIAAFTGTQALVWLTMQASNNTAQQLCRMSLSNVGSLIPGDGTSLALGGVAATSYRASLMLPVFGLSVGLHSFEPVYRVTGGMGTISFRRISVLPL